MVQLQPKFANLIVDWSLYKLQITVAVFCSPSWLVMWFDSLKSHLISGYGTIQIGETPTCTNFEKVTALFLAISCATSIDICAWSRKDFSKQHLKLHWPATSARFQSCIWREPGFQVQCWGTARLHSSHKWQWIQGERQGGDIKISILPNQRMCCIQRIQDFLWLPFLQTGENQC